MSFAILFALTPFIQGGLWIVLGAGVTLGAVGFRDDLAHLQPGVRLVAQFSIAGLSGVAICLTSDRSLFWAALIALFVTGYTNAFNFMDGVNGISALSTMVAGGAFCLAGSTFGALDLSLLGAALMGAAGGFLPMNARGKIFLGDVGSYSLGAMISLGAALGISKGVPWPIMVGPLLVYLADTGTTLIRRAHLGTAVFSAHRTHAYQKLTDLGLSHLQVAGLCSLASLITAAGGWLLADVSVVGGTAIWLIILVAWVSGPLIVEHAFLDTDTS